MIAGLAGLGRRQVALLASAAVAMIAAALLLIQGLMSQGGTGVDTLFTASMVSYGALLYVLVGVVVLWRRPGHGIGRLSMSVGLALTGSILLMVLPLPWQLTDIRIVLAQGLAFVGWIVGGSLLVVWFPDGRRTSRLGALLELVLLAAMIGLVVASSQDELRPTGAVARLFDIAGAVGFAGILLVYLGAVVDLGLRYRHADDLRQTQMRWVLAAEAMCVVALIGFFAVGQVLDWLFAVMIVSFGLPVLAIGVAVTRYHLYDIDRIVSRSISYLVVTAVLVVVFASLTLLMQAIISVAVAAPGTALDPRVVALSTLVVAALFNPLRARVQSVVDRRFHRERYDSERIVAGFSGRLRDQLDLATVSGELRATTTRALEPSTTGVWLRAKTAQH